MSDSDKVHLRSVEELETELAESVRLAASWIERTQQAEAEVERLRLELKHEQDAYRGTMAWAEPLNQRCNRAEAEAKDYRGMTDRFQLAWEQERALADELAGALGDFVNSHPALARWEEARRG